MAVRGEWCRGVPLQCSSLVGGCRLTSEHCGWSDGVCGLCSLAAMPMAYMGYVPSRSVTVFVKSLCYLTQSTTSMIECVQLCGEVVGAWCASS